MNAPGIRGAIWLVGCFGAWLAASSSARADDFFEQKVRPVLVQHCYRCHSSEAEQTKKLKGDLRVDSKAGLLKGGVSGRAIVPGKPTQSLLIKAIEFADDLRMPPKGKLIAGQIADLTKWVEQGAPWPGEEQAATVRQGGFAVRDQDRRHWSFQPVRAIEPPQVKNPAWPANPIDRFVLARLEKEGLSPAPPAAPEQWLRRVGLDLIGLPPTVEEIDAFVRELNSRDSSPQLAMEKVIDRLLASPHYGERWARHWLDLARYADSSGFEFDGPRPNSLKYRDYVIRALNDDKPYDRFVSEHLAGDELFPSDSDAGTATLFHMLGRSLPANPVAFPPDQRRQDKLNDITDTVGTIFLGLTIGCAQCHDHKFEPIAQRDYYALQAFFAPAITANNAGNDKGGDIAGLRNNPKAVPKTHLLRGGALHQKGDEVEPGFPTVLANGQPVRIEPVSAASTGRRTVLARWLASTDHPLTARVLVNRVWQHHFGRGIVPTASDFGLRGDPPSHPELLDWLAHDFVHGEPAWNLKRLHRQIVLSQTYRQASIATLDARTRDPENRLLSRFPRRRLECEIIRDSLLAVSGRLNVRVGGPPVLPPLPAQVSFGREGGFTVSKDPADHTRRSIYIVVRRNIRFPLLEVFDPPDCNISVARRDRSITPPQALAMLNSEEVRQSAKALAERLGQGDEAIVAAFRHTLGRRPTEQELTLARGFVASSGLTELCRALLNTTEFVYLE